MHLPTLDFKGSFGPLDALGPVVLAYSINLNRLSDRVELLKKFVFCIRLILVLFYYQLLKTGR